MSYYLFTEERGSVQDVGNKLVDFAQQVVLGELSPLEFKLYLNRLKDVITECEEMVDEVVLTEGEKYKGQVIHGYRVEISSSGRYKYDHIPEIVELKKRLKFLEQLHQSAYKFHTQGTCILDDETGETITPAEFVPSKTYVKLQKEKGSL